MKDTNESGKLRLAFFTIILAIVGIIVGYIKKTPIMDTFSAGTWITLVAYLLSLGSAREKHSNAVPLFAFFFTFGALCVTVVFSSLV